jgi:hypothetical protein
MKEVEIGGGDVRLNLRRDGKFCLHSVNFVMLKLIFVDSYKIDTHEIWYIRSYGFFVYDFFHTNVPVNIFL